MGIREDVSLAEDRQNASHFLTASESLRVQEDENNARLVQIKKDYPTGIDTVLSNRAIFVEVGQRLEMKSVLTEKKASYKSDLTNIKPKLLDSNYEAEIQTEIDNL